jgi:mRNA interferase MazF
MAVKRSDIVLVALPGDFGKPRPALIVQSNIFNEQPFSVIVCPLTTEAVDAPAIRISVEPTEATGLHERSYIMIDKIASVRPQRLRNTIGTIDDGIMRQVDSALMIILGLA